MKPVVLSPSKHEQLGAPLSPRKRLVQRVERPGVNGVLLFPNAPPLSGRFLKSKNRFGSSASALLTPEEHEVIN